MSQDLDRVPTAAPRWMKGVSPKVWNLMTETAGLTASALLALFLGALFSGHA
jgi:hypothetical protein